MRKLPFLLVGLFFLFTFLTLTQLTPAYAATTPGPRAILFPKMYEAPYQNPNPFSVAQLLSDCQDINSTCFTSHIEGNLENIMGLRITGATDKNGNPVFSGAIPFFTSGIAAMATTKPASAGQYVQYLASHIHVPGTPQMAYAATGQTGPGGVGFAALTPVLELWTVVRNVAYVLFAILFLVIGIMIMFRVKIDPKTAVNIQNALPKIIMALVIVTFSYAIAGFLVDLMYVSIALLLTIVKSINGFGSFATQFEQDVLSGQTIFSFMLTGGLMTSQNAFWAINDIVGSFLLQTPLNGAPAGIAGFLTGGLAFLIVAVAILWALFKTWLMLISAYVNVILAIIFSPLLLMLDALPGQNMLSMWIRMILSNLLAFPLVIAMMFVGVALGGGVRTGLTPASGFVPPLIGGNSQTAVQALIGLGVLLTIPKAVEILQEILKSPQFKLATAWSEAVKFGYGQTAERAGRGIYKEWYGPNVASREAAYQQRIQEEGRIKAGVRTWDPVAKAWVTPVLVGPRPQRPNRLLRNLPNPKG